MGTTFAVGGDFWPHGQIALQYGVLGPAGVADRAVFLVDRDGRIQFAEVYPGDEVPPVTPVLEALRRLTAERDKRRVT